MLSDRLEIREGESITAFNIRKMRAEHLEEAAIICDQHANFLKSKIIIVQINQAKHLMERCEEAKHLSKKIRELAMS